MDRSNSQARSGHLSPRHQTSRVTLARLSPVRVELLVGRPDGGACERVEWRREVGSGLLSRAKEDGPWGAPARLSPY